MPHIEFSIAKVANGYIVHPAYDAANDRGGREDTESIRVFETFDSMVTHLRQALGETPRGEPTLDEVTRAVYDHCKPR